MESFVVLVATGFGLGWLPWAPGTFGSLIGLPLAFWVVKYSVGRQALIIATLLALAVPLCHRASLLLGGGDLPQIVADEFVAFPVAVVGLAAARRPWVLAMAFVLFRLFDITKPLPVGQLEAIGGGLGIVLDDVMAAVYARIVLAIGNVVWRWSRVRHDNND